MFLGGPPPRSGALRTDRSLSVPAVPSSCAPLVHRTFFHRPCRLHLPDAPLLDKTHFHPFQSHHSFVSRQHTVSKNHLLYVLLFVSGRLVAGITVGVAFFNFYLVPHYSSARFSPNAFCLLVARQPARSACRRSVCPPA